MNLEKWFLELVVKYEKWAKFQIEWKSERNASIKKIEFPFEYRDGQREIVTSVYKTILRKKKLFIQAPTGRGENHGGRLSGGAGHGGRTGGNAFFI